MAMGKRFDRLVIVFSLLEAGASSLRNREGLRLRPDRTLLSVRLVLRPLDWRPYLPRLKL